MGPLGLEGGVLCLIWLGLPSGGVTVPSFDLVVDVDGPRVIGEGRCEFLIGVPCSAPS